VLQNSQYLIYDKVAKGNYSKFCSYLCALAAGKAKFNQPKHGWAAQ
jgi:hypothetical protein